MRVAVVCPTDGGLSGGFRKYLRRLVPLLGADARVGELVVYVPDAALAAVRANGLPEACAIVGDLRAELSRFEPDVVFVPTARTIEAAAPVVTMVRNMEPLEQPFAGLGPRAALRNLARALAARWACRRATRVIAVSHHVAGFLAQRWGLGADRLAVVPHGIDTPPDDAGVTPAGAPVGVPFFFGAGSLRPARGLDDLVGAARRLSGRLPLVLVAGAADPDTRGYAMRLQARGAAAGLRFVGALDEAQMRWCFRNAAGFLMTSRAEACPNTALEAMAHGSVVVSTDRPPMPEFFGEAARYYRAGDSAALADQIDWLLGARGDERASLAAAAKARASRFSWAETARRTIDVLESALRAEVR